MEKAFFGGVLAFIAFALTTAYAGTEHHPDPGNAKCESYYSNFLEHDVGYCVDFAGPRVPGERVVYFMHGLGGSAETWIANGYAEALKATCEKNSCDPVAFISFDTQPTSFFSDTRGEKTGTVAYETWFLTEFMPMMEQKYSVCTERHCRGLLGKSMGGLGALKTALRYSGLFSIAAVNCAALEPFSIFESDDDWSDYWDRHPIGSLKGNLILDIVREIFPTEELANQNDPVWLVDNWKPSAVFPSLYFDVGDQDDFGFQEGFERFSRALDAKGFPHTSALIPGADHELQWERRWVVLKFLLERLR